MELGDPGLWSAIPVDVPFCPLPAPMPALTDAQLARLHRCANGNTLRFEAASIVDALIEAGYAKEGIGRVVTVTARGQQYLRIRAVRLRLALLDALG